MSGELLDVQHWQSPWAQYNPCSDTNVKIQEDIQDIQHTQEMHCTCCGQMGRMQSSLLMVVNVFE